MKLACLFFLALFLSFELHVQSSFIYTIKSKLNNTPPVKKESLDNISVGLGIAKAIPYKDDEFVRNNDSRFLFNINVTAKIYHPLYLNAGFEYNKEDLRGYEEYYNISV